MKKDDEGCLRIKLIEYHDYRTLMGPCLISFSLPLFIPGVVLTVVGSYGNEHTFVRFGGWHITGIVILGVAVLLFIVGVILRCCFRPVLSADIEQHLTPTSSVISGKHNLGYEKDGKIYSSNSFLKGNGKVAHRDNQLSDHVHVSTHESVGHRKDLNRNGDISRSNHQRNSHESRAQNIDTFTTSQQRHNKHQDKLESENITHIPDLETYQGPTKKLRRKKSEERKHHTNTHTSSKEVESGDVRTKVTATIVAEADTSSDYRSRDPSSDTNENSQFLPKPSDESPKRRKKKKKRRKASRGDPNDPIEVSITERSVTELPELRVKPALVHDGIHHHPPNQHVHFEAAVDTVDKSEEIHDEKHSEVEENGDNSEVDGAIRNDPLN